ncbi:hypothetical protein [Paraflavitalea pollutisoli]|uniref:hypothetical protein n=1 Tax=Paraflavitalea pollutisoli TaxID=3034143 RepID=UPI0023EC36EA|nr:hypothetical protein [Paraflavitalea sp. H1-2-19X]
MTTQLLRLYFTATLVLLFSCMATNLQAQSYIDEDFIEILEKNARFMLQDVPAAFKETNTPAKWDKESAVLIGVSRNVVFDRKSSGGFFTRRERSLYFFEKSRMRVKLNDNNAVKAFSEIYFRYGSKEDGFIARIIKPGDTAINIDLKSAVAVERGTDIPDLFNSFFDQVAGAGYQYYKVPVSDLEPGDILEYVTTTKSKLDVTRSGYVEFSPIYEVCSKHYPVLHNEIAIETDDKSFFKSLSLNGAPIFKKEPASDGFFRYVFVDKNRDTEKDINFISPFIQYPIVKFQVIYSNNDQAKGALIGEKGELKSSFSKEELARKAWEDYEQVSSAPFAGSQFFTVQQFIDGCYSELVKLGAKSWNEQEYINKAYYLVRNKILFQQGYLSDKKFAHIFGSLLYQRDIKSEIIITASNNIGRLKDILFEEEIRYIIKIGDKLYFNVTDYSNPGELDESLIDNEAYIIYAPAKKGGAQEIKPFTLPGTVALDNSSLYQYTTELTPDMKGLKVSRTSHYKGIQKAKNTVNALRYTTFMLDDYKNYGGNNPTDKMKARESEEYDKSVRSLTDEFKKQKPEYVKDRLESEFEQPVNNVKFTLVTDGRTQKKNVLSFREEFELPDFVRKAGKKYLVNLTGLVGSQLQIKKEERERKNDIDNRYPRTFTWSIQFKIPDGYKAEGLTELNKMVDNETGAFKLIAKEENGMVLIDIQKVYKLKGFSAAKWSDMLAFIDAAYNNTYKYILLTPKQ